jgi:hypothetical protein
MPSQRSILGIGLAVLLAISEPPSVSTSSRGAAFRSGTSGTPGWIRSRCRRREKGRCSMSSGLPGSKSLGTETQPSPGPFSVSPVRRREESKSLFRPRNRKSVAQLTQAVRLAASGYDDGALGKRPERRQYNRFRREVVTPYPRYAVLPMCPGRTHTLTGRRRRIRTADPLGVNDVRWQKSQMIQWRACSIVAVCSISVHVNLGRDG